MDKHYEWDALYQQGFDVVRILCINTVWVMRFFCDKLRAGSVYKSESTSITNKAYRVNPCKNGPRASQITIAGKNLH